MITAEILADSVNEHNVRLTTFLLTYPRFIHSEVLTHRAFSRCSSSSRAIPSAKLIGMVMDNPALPESWGKNKKGMQAEEELDEESKSKALEFWLEARDHALDGSARLGAIGVHKQLANRLIEPFSHITVVLSGTEFNNFFGLRASPYAQPEFMVLAYRMLDKYMKSIVTRLNRYDWHMPFQDDVTLVLGQTNKLKVCTARCARTSYLGFDSTRDWKADVDLHDKLEVSGHWSPFEHCAQAVNEESKSNFGFGWKQYRKLFDSEVGVNVDLNEIMARKPDWVTL